MPLEAKEPCFNITVDMQKDRVPQSLKFGDAFKGILKSHWKLNLATVGKVVPLLLYAYHLCFLSRILH